VGKDLNETAIEVEKLSKRYRIGATVSYKTLRESLVNAFWAPFRRTRPSEESPGESEKPTHIWALKDVSFKIMRGQAVGVIGANGSGKSTLLKILSRITRPTEGHATIFGRVASLLEVGTGFHPELTGRENIQLNAAVLGMKNVEVKRKFGSIVDFAGDSVKRFIDTPVKRYSSGMYVRLAFAIAAHLDPDVLLVDEVLAVGDAAFQEKCLGKMGDITKEGRTIIFVSHNMNAVLQLCSRTILLESGKAVDDGDTAQVIPHYLKSLPVPMGEVVFEPHSGSKGVNILKAYVTNGKGEASSFVPYTEPFCIVIEYEVDSPVKGLRIGFRLHNVHSVAILHTATSDGNLPEDLVGTPGRHRALAWIPGAWLAPGRYYAELGAWSPAVGHHQHVQSAFGFDILGADTEGLGSEVLRPILEWKII
jgi:lipopolysaccharide transport system ATP-binding protein